MDPIVPRHLDEFASDHSSHLLEIVSNNCLQLWTLENTFDVKRCFRKKQEYSLQLKEFCERNASMFPNKLAKNQNEVTIVCRIIGMSFYYHKYL